MELSEKAEEILESLWIRAEEGKEDSLSPDDLEVIEKGVIKELLVAGYIEFSHDRVRLTARGRPEAASVVRRHRLAERLLTDVLNTREILIHERACKFEHLLDRGLDESVCILLGHPKICPHGKPIPPGRCCLEGENQAQKLVAPLSELAAGQKGKVAYTYDPESNKLPKLISMGILPGVPISLIQTFPSYVFQVRQTQFAVDKEIASAIYVRLIEAEAATGTGEEGGGERGRRARRRFGLGRRRPG